mmetsp:Transcript_2386/g.5302  ORF Transcript_2386/g.5302 Transcript_2386/m.5302 type:complete len:80 (-) Transcript_2386:2200-2439(-)
MDLFTSETINGECLFTVTRTGFFKRRGSAIDIAWMAQNRLEASKIDRQRHSRIGEKQVSLAFVRTASFKIRQVSLLCLL